MKRPVLLLLAITALTSFSVVYHLSILVLPVLITGAVYLLIKRKMTGLIIINLLFLFITFVHASYLTQQTTVLDGFHNKDVTITAQVTEYPEYIDGRTRAVLKLFPLMVSAITKIQIKYYCPFTGKTCISHRVRSIKLPVVLKYPNPKPIQVVLIIDSIYKQRNFILRCGQSRKISD